MRFKFVREKLKICFILKNLFKLVLKLKAFELIIEQKKNNAKFEISHKLRKIEKKTFQHILNTFIFLD